MNSPRLLAAACCLLALAACDPPPGDPAPTDSGGNAPAPPTDPGTPPPPTDSGSSGGTPAPTTPANPGAPPATGDGGGGAAGPGALRVSIAPGEAPPGASSIELELAALALFQDAPRWRDPDSPCDGGEPAALAPLSARVDVPFGDGPRVTLAELQGGGAPREVWLVLRKGTLRAADRTYPVHAALLCTLPDGLQYTLLRARPGGAAAQGAHEVALGLGRAQLTIEQVDCAAEPTAEECATTDDGQDADPGTRVRYRFVEELPATTIE
jgi:hypothetical protein